MQKSNRGNSLPKQAARFIWVAIFFTLPVATTWAASCCGGGSASSLILPKFAKTMLDVAVDRENYDGFWNDQGEYVADPQGTQLQQTRLNTGVAQRLAARWQGSVSLPYVSNDNRYAGLSSSSQGLGDAGIGVWYEFFDEIKCVWKVRKLKDLEPATYFGLNLTLPTGESPYGDVDNSFDITGRGFYRLDANLLLDKTVYPFNATLLMSYGRHLERPVNREYGRYVEPYHKQLGDRALTTASVGYTQFLDSMATFTYTLALSNLREARGEIDGRRDMTSGMKKRSLALTVAYANAERDWVTKLSWSHANRSDDQGRNFPVTDIITLGVTHVLR